VTPQNINGRDNTKSLETRRRQLIEKRDKYMDRVHELERKLSIQDPWTPGSLEWVAAHEMIKLRDYRKAVDKLESLVVSRIFELSKMNMSETGMSSYFYGFPSLIHIQVINYDSTLPMLYKPARKPSKQP
jgi:hypothetical protein